MTLDKHTLLEAASICDEMAAAEFSYQHHSRTDYAMQACGKRLRALIAKQPENPAPQAKVEPASAVPSTQDAKDAARYRWLQSKGRGCSNTYLQLNPRDMDAAIDAVIDNRAKP